MTRQAFRFTLWVKRPWWQGGETVAAIEGDQAWIDVEDETAAVEWFAEIVARAGGREDRISRYAADIMDLATGQPVTRLAPSPGDLRRVRSPASPFGQQDQSSPALRQASDEDLVRELCRRLTRR